jgi:hypothetical protein
VRGNTEEGTEVGTEEGTEEGIFLKKNFRLLNAAWFESATKSVRRISVYKFLCASSGL